MITAVISPLPLPLPVTDRLALLLGLPSGWASLARLDPAPATAAVLARALEATAR